MARIALIAALVALMVLMLLTVVTTLWPRPANAEGCPSTALAGRDPVEIRASEEGHMAEIRYHNIDPPSTQPLDTCLQFDGVVVQVIVRTVANTNAERITVIPHRDDIFAVPAEIEIEDGNDTIIQLMLAGF